MANKAVPTSIDGVTLHDKARQRTNQLLSDLEAVGVGPVTKVKSGIDRLRLVASAYFTLLDDVSGTRPDTDEDVNSEVQELCNSLTR